MLGFQNKNLKNMRKLLYPLVLILGAFIILSCSKDDDTDPTKNDVIQTDASIEVGRTMISQNGGTVVIEDTGGPLEGMTITVPNQSYATSVVFEISYENVVSHELGIDFEPVSPIINIENGGEYANRIMTVRLPLSVDLEEHVMAFYVDKKTGNLDPIVTMNRGSNFIEVGTRHFSSIVLSKTPKSVLLSANVNSGFVPASNGFSFPNEGTYPTPLGLCAGMSIASQYYFNEGINSSIFSFYDNNQLHARTTAWWQDDIRGLKLTSWLQRSADDCWTNNYEEISKIQAEEVSTQFWNMLYAMHLSRKTILVGLENPQKPDYGHLVLMTGYEVRNNKVVLNIYDPNHVGEQKELVYDMTSNSFENYVSAVNSEALRDGFKIDYNKFTLIPLDMIMNPIDLDYAHTSATNGSIGSALFPEYEVFAVPKDKKFEEVKLDLRHDHILQSLPFDEFDFDVRGVDASVGLKLETVIWSKFGFERTSPAETFKLTSKDTLVGLWLKGKPASVKYDKWYGFNWFQIKKQSFWIEPADTTVAPNVDVKFVLRNNQTLPSNRRLEWNFGDNNTATSSDSMVIHKFEESGSFVVTCTIHDLSTNQVAGEVKSDISVALYPKIEITLSGQKANGSTIKISDNFGNIVDLPFYTWSNKISSRDLDWDENAFEVEFAIVRSARTYTYRISGELNKEFTKIQTLSAIVTGVGEPGYAFNSAIVIQDFPIKEIQPGEIVGDVLNGRAAEAKVAQFSYSESSEVGGSDYTWKLESIDWSSEDTQLLIQIEKE